MSNKGFWLGILNKGNELSKIYCMLAVKVVCVALQVFCVIDKRINND